jgi:hypothetical protein
MIKIFTGAKPFLKANIKPFGIMEIRMLTQWKKGLFLNVQCVMLLPSLTTESYGLLGREVR